MFTTHEPTVKATIAFLKCLKVKVNQATVNNTLQNHPDWPSLLCVSDSLQKWNVPNAAGKLNVSDIDQLPVPFMAEILKRETTLVTVASIAENNISYTGNGKGTITETRENFLKKWTGVYLLAERMTESGEKEFRQKKQQFLIKSILPLSLFILLFGVLLNVLQKNITVTAAFLKTGIYLQFFILVAGVIVSALLLWYEIDRNNSLLKKVCTGFTKGNCNAILTGKAAKVFNWLSWSEVGFFYFTGGVLTLISTPYNQIPYIFNLIALPYIIFSIYYQWKIARQWCVLCLVVQGLLFLGAINVFINGLATNLETLTAGSVAIVVIVYLLPAICWYVTKPYLLLLQQAKNTKREYLRIKFNTEVFDTLLKKQKKITISAEGLGIVLGNPAAKYELTKVCNPYCSPCSKVHPEIEKLLESNNNIRARIIFMATNEEKDYRKDAVKHLMAIAEKNDGHQTKKALNDWYMAPKKDYNTFATKYPMNAELKAQEVKIDDMSSWCKAVDIAYTPTIFINGYQLPAAYVPGDLNYFLAE